MRFLLFHGPVIFLGFVVHSARREVKVGAKELRNFVAFVLKENVSDGYNDGHSLSLFRRS